MPKTANLHDTFTAIAEPKRRELCEYLRSQELTVNELVAQTRWSQPAVSKHLRVLRQAGIVSERKSGRNRVYRLNGKQLQPIQLWVRQFEAYWTTQFDQLDDYLSNLQKGDDDE